MFGFKKVWVQKIGDQKRFGPEIFGKNFWVVKTGPMFPGQSCLNKYQQDSCALVTLSRKNAFAPEGFRSKTYLAKVDQSAQ